MSNYKLVEIPIPNMGLAVVGGNVAAAVMSEPFLTQSLLRGDGKLLGWLLGEPPFERMELTLIVFRADFYRNNPQAVRAFLRSQLQAVKYINQNPDRVRSILAKRLGTQQGGQQENKPSTLAVGCTNDPVLWESTQ